MSIEVWHAMNKLSSVLETLIENNGALQVGGLMSSNYGPLRNIESELKHYCEANDTFFSVSYVHSHDYHLRLQPKFKAWPELLVINTNIPYYANEAKIFTPQDFTVESYTDNFFMDKLHTVKTKESMTLIIRYTNIQKQCKYKLYFEIDYFTQQTNGTKYCLRISVENYSNPANKAMFVRLQDFSSVTDLVDDEGCLKNYETFKSKLIQALCTKNLKHYEQTWRAGTNGYILEGPSSYSSNE